MPESRASQTNSPNSNEAPPPGLGPQKNSRAELDEVDLRELWAAVWEGKWIIFLVSATFAVASILYALSLPSIYESRALLAPSEDSQGGMARMAGQLGGLASLAGISVGAAAGDNKVLMAIEVLKSRKFITSFVEEHAILPELIAVKRWSRVDNRLIFDEALYDANNEEWVRSVDLPRTPKPSSWEAYKAFTKMLTVSQDKETGFVSVALEHQSPHVAKQWVSLLVDSVNEVMRQKDVVEARRSIQFLQNQLEQVALADMRTVFYQLIEEQTKTIMLAEVRDEYVFTTIDPPVAAEEKNSPKRGLILFVGAFLGLLVSTTYVLVRHFARRPIASGSAEDFSSVEQKN